MTFDFGLLLLAQNFKKTYSGKEPFQLMPSKVSLVIKAGQNLEHSKRQSIPIFTASFGYGMVRLG
jgi:hypothetical protein